MATGSALMEQEFRRDALEHSVQPSTLYVSQFLLGPRKMEVQPGWCTFSIAGSLFLAAHPDLSVVQVESEDGTRQLTLVGEVMDPRAPDLGDEVILRALLNRFTSRAGLAAATAPLGGRWILIGKNGSDSFLFHDALGLRQVFHTDLQSSKELWAMSQPGMAMDLLRLRIDPEASDFIDSHAFRSRPEYRWPGAASPVRGLKRLLPNHVLNLKSGVVERYWPSAPLERIPFEGAIERLSRALSGLVRATIQRHDTVLSLTAGIDSRLVLAAARDFTDRIDFVTVRQAKMSDRHPDIVIPRKLLAHLDLPHEVIRAGATMSAEFGRYFKRNVFLAHDHYGPDAEALRAHNKGRRVALTGSGAEVGRCPFRAEIPDSDRQQIDAPRLARLQRMGAEPFAVKSFNAWLVDARERFDVKLLDLFDWEQGHGSWLAMTQLEFDTAWHDIFTPYNSREVLTTLLGVDEIHRNSPNYEIFRTLIKKLWPDLLRVPINPVPRAARARKAAKKLVSLARSWF